MFYIVGLGNPGKEYENTRHNAGRISVERFRKDSDLPEFKADKVHQALISKGAVLGEKVMLMLPETFMNKSGASLKPLVLTEKKAEKLIVVRDDLDLPLGKIRIQFNRSSGGHRGVESIVKALRTEKFIQIKIGIAPSTPSGKTKKPKGDKVLDFIVGPFKKPELETMKKVAKEVSTALAMVVEYGKEKAMGEFNS